jgi:hypothetical protein
MTVDILTDKQSIHSDSDGRIHIMVPIRMVRRGRTHIITTGAESPMLFEPPLVRNNMINTIAKAFVWSEMLADGRFASMRDIAAKEKIKISYVARLLKLTLLAPDIVEAILNGRQPKTLILADMCTFVPLEWSEQRRKYGFPQKTSGSNPAR